MPSEPEGTAGKGVGGGTQVDRRPWEAGLGCCGSWKARPGVSSVLRQACPWQGPGGDEAHLAGAGRGVEGVIGGFLLASASDHLHLEPGRGPEKTRNTG